MDPTLLPPPADDSDASSRPKLASKRERTIQPLSAGAPSDPRPSGQNDLLEELRRKTAKLAASVDPDQPDTPKTSELLNPSIAKAAQPDTSSSEPDQAVELVRTKIAKLYVNEPDAQQESELAEAAGKRRSKHQDFMHTLTNSGKSLEQIQTQWHTYYTTLPEKEKHEVWQEFYSTHGKRQEARTTDLARNPQLAARNRHGSKKLSKRQHLKSLMFGVAMSALSLLLVSFVFFNEAYIAPFVSPGQSVSATPIIGNISGPVDPEPKIIIPKINLEVPVVFDLGSTRESDIQNALEDGVVHYASSPNPGEKGNSVIVGHSSNNILNSGKYKFAFVLLRRLQIDDTFFVHKDGVRYTYKIYQKEVVPPTDLTVLGPQDRSDTITLITCDPPGTSLNRLIITAEQISPSPDTNSQSSAPEIAVDEVTLPSNAPSLWSRLWPF